ncbi:hypothetical protein AAFF_G00409230 [Aldrovandia affinis]|uniref:Uncharacterized protein n=1 Tax=Aldrovandia affinis TaxID=143900 RepID=A0AAD7VYN4_9TELE|nr:hypothetical protein AAFF_G00409230 [Aldrovandia affinis]
MQELEPNPAPAGERALEKVSSIVGPSSQDRLHLERGGNECSKLNSLESRHQWPVLLRVTSKQQDVRGGCERQDTRTSSHAHSITQLQLSIKRSSCAGAAVIATDVVIGQARM